MATNHPGKLDPDWLKASHKHVATVLNRGRNIAARVLVPTSGRRRKRRNRTADQRRWTGNRRQRAMHSGIPISARLGLSRLGIPRGDLLQVIEFG